MNRAADRGGVSRPSRSAWTRTDCARPPARASSASATRCRSLAWTPPGPIEADDAERAAGSRALRRTPRGVPGVRRTSRRRWRRRSVADPGGRAGRRPGSGDPTSELPIWPAGRPTASSEARSDRRAASAPGVPARPASERPRWHRWRDRHRSRTHRGRRGRWVAGRLTRRRVGRGRSGRPGPTIPAISSGLSDAPPTSAPSMLGSARKSAMLAAVTLPPYRTGRSSAALPHPRPTSVRRIGVGHRGRIRTRGRSGPSRSPRPARRRRPGRRPPGRPDRARRARRAAASRRRDSARPASRSSARSPTQRMARRPASVGPPELLADQLVRLAEVPPPLRVADDDPRREADEHRGRDLAGIRAGRLVMDVLGADRRRPGPTRRGRRGPPPGDTNGGQMTRVTSGSRVRLAIVAASSAASAGVVCIFQFAATITSRIAANHARAGRRTDRRPTPRRRRGGPASRCARAIAARPTDASRAARRARTGSLRASRDGRPRRPGRCRTVRRGDRRPRGSSIASSCRPAALDRALEVGRLGVEDPIELAAQGPRHLARLEFEQGAARPDPPQERPDRLGALPGHDTAAAAQPPRCGQLEVAEPGRQDRRLLGRRPRTRGASGRRRG